MDEGRPDSGRCAVESPLKRRRLKTRFMPERGVGGALWRGGAQRDRGGAGAKSEPIFFGRKPMTARDGARAGEEKPQTELVVFDVRARRADVSDRTRPDENSQRRVQDRRCASFLACQSRAPHTFSEEA